MIDKVGPGIVIIKPIEATNTHEGIIIEQSRKHPKNKGEVVMVGDEDEFGTPIWEVGDIVLLPMASVITFDHPEQGLLKACHHRRIPYGYKDEC